MDPTERIVRIRALIRYRDQLTALERKALRAKTENRELIPLARGCYISRQHWANLYGEGRQIAVALAHSDRASHRPVFSHYTAAALWGLPLFAFTDTRVHALTPSTDRMRSSSRVLRHQGVLAESEVFEIAGVRLSSSLRTLIDVSRSACGELALGCVDAALHRRYFANRSDGKRLQEEWREAALTQLGSLRGQRGVSKARRVIEFADGRAESVLESVGRLRFDRAGIRTEIQVPVLGPKGFNYYSDFLLPDHNAFVEADGEAKYFDEQLLQGRHPRDVLREEKAREDWIRGTTKKPMYRFESSHAATQNAFEQRFASFGIFGSSELRKLSGRLP